VKMVAMDLSGAGVAVLSCCGEGPLPRPFAGGMRRFAREGAGELDVSGTSGEIAAMKLVDVAQVFAKGLANVSRQERDAIVSSFSVADDDVTRCEVDVFHAKLRTFE
jgi:hypothetical protein